MYEKDLPWNWKLQDGKYFLTEFDMNFGKNYMAFYVFRNALNHTQYEIRFQCPKIARCD